MKKLKVLLINKNLIAGGIETSLLSFIDNMKDYVDIELVLFNKTGALIDRLPQDIKVYEGGKILKYLNRDCTPVIGTVLTNKKFSIKSFLFNFIKKLGGRKILSKFALIGQKIKSNYDVVISYNALNDISSNFALKCVKAKKKYAYIHSDVSKYAISKNYQRKLKKFDKIICVSESCANIAKRKFDKMKEKIDYLYNFQNADKMKKLSNEFLPEYGEAFNIITPARLSEEKAHLRTLSALKKLHDQKYEFVWNIVGDGDKRTEIEQYIRDNNMSSYVKLWGNQSNPYPYIKNADLLYLGSYHEAAPMVYFEAMILGVPVLTTNTASANELVGDKGYVCDNNDESILNSFKNIMDNPAEFSKKKNELSKFEYNNKEIVNKFLNWINEN